ncbi:MAG: hypothetical protein IJH41_04105 [Eubacterium sp.]|nr:hypothetical protein [Eubacterium sp.]MBQ4457989.1 hypothetical protein [Clostridia bacterium]
MKRKVIYDNGQIEITARELAFSLIITLLMLAVGFLISEEISSDADEANREYEQAIKIDNDQELFEYGIHTNAGNAFVYGTLEALDPVSVPEIEGQYAVIEIRKERYTMHTRIVTHTDGRGHTYTTTEIYYTWDEVDRDEVTCSRIAFIDHEFEYGMIGFPDPDYNTTVKESATIRYKYYTCKTEYEGAIYTYLGDDTIKETNLITAKDIDEAVKKKRMSPGLMVGIFWIIWIGLAAGAIFAFCAHDNEWIE